MQVTLLEQTTRTAKIQEYLYRHVASSGIPKQLHCLDLKLAHEYSINANARLQLPSAELVPALVDNSYFHFVLASDNILAASVVASSLVQNSFRPEKVVLHIITDSKTFSPMQAWFSLHPLTPPGLIAFHGHVHAIDSFWHMLGLGYQDNTSIADAQSAGVIHFNGRAKPWLDIAFPQLRPLWTKYVNFSDKFINSCHIRET